MHVSNSRPSRRRTPRARNLFAVGLAGLLFGSSCAGLSKIPNAVHKLFGGKVHIQVVVDDQLNGDTPLAVDLVVVYDKALLEELKSIDAAKWFPERKQFLKDFGKELQVHKWEWVPGQSVKPFKTSYRAGAHGGVLYAYYQSPGAHRAVVKPLEGFILNLGETDFDIVPLKPKHQGKASSS